jgi:trk system potassium uptake protein
MKFCVIGLGRFGYQVATGLSEHGQEIMAIDSNEAIVASIRDQVTHAICMRVTDEASLRSVGIDEINTVIVATGENFAESILITALLKKHLHTPRVIARAINDIHQEILNLVGADEIILPEKEIGMRLADSLGKKSQED